MHFIDPHALHERWNYDRLVGEGKRGTASEKLLMPIVMELSPAEAAAAVDMAQLLSKYGFELAVADSGHIEARVVPSYLQPGDVETLLRQILSDVESAAEHVEARRERLLASLACRSSVLLGKNLPEEEVSRLVAAFFDAGGMPTCPHGRPTSITITMDELARRFGR